MPDKKNNKKENKKVILTRRVVIAMTIIKAFNWTLTGLSLILVIAFNGIGYEVNDYVIPACIFPLIMAICFCPYNEVFLFKHFEENLFKVKTIAILLCIGVFGYFALCGKATLIANTNVLLMLNR